MISLRPYQEQAVAKIRASYASGRRAPLFVLATGGGKTVTFSYMAKHAAEKGRRVGILVHRQELLNQASNSLSAMGIPHGLIAPGEPETDDRIQIASVPSLLRRMDRYFFNFLIIDEAHHATAGSWRKILVNYPEAKVLGVTATPCRSDGAGLGDMFDDLILGPLMRELIGLGFLVEPHIYAPPTELDLTGIKRRMGDYDHHELEQRLDRPKITGSAVEHYLQLCAGERAIAFCVSLLHAENVARQFREAGLRAQRIDGAMDNHSRREAIDGLRSGRLDILTSVDLIGEGLDIPDVSAAILLRPTQSTGLYLQQVGRALRFSPGKKRAIILDHVGNTTEHGLPDEDREWSLESSRHKLARVGGDESLLAVRQCAKCYFVFRPRSNCPECGAAGAQRPRKIAEREGELKRITKEELEKAKAVQKRSRIDEELRCENMEQLAELGRARGHSSGWAYYRWPFIEKARRWRKAG